MGEAIEGARRGRVVEADLVDVTDPAEQVAALVRTWTTENLAAEDSVLTVRIMRGRVLVEYKELKTFHIDPEVGLVSPEEEVEVEGSSS